MKYRTEIDGLRAAAVLPVIFYHAGFALFSGGFVGVDVFFVISGYLITGIIFEELKNGDFSIARFYERRARRILPALFAVLVASIPFAWIWMFPKELVAFSQSIEAVCLFVSNFLFWNQTGYFAASAELKPLLHTWSLAVEEQYYIFFPPLMALVWKFAPRRLFHVLALLWVSSFGLSEWMAHAHPDANFFLLPSRTWELMSGALAVIWEKKYGTRTSDVLSFAGLTAILVAILSFTKDTPVPSFMALLPVTGAVLVVMFARSGTIAGRILSIRPIVGVGLISYSAYLWHQPIFAFARIRLADDPGPAGYLLLVALSMIMAFLSWRYIERPWRRGAFSARTIFIMSPVIATILIGIGVSGYVNAGFPSRMPPGVGDIMHYSRREARWDDCLDRVRNACVYGKGSSPGFAVWGDSHAHALVPGLDRLAEESGQSFALFTHNGCPSLVDIYRVDAVSWCKAFNDAVIARLARDRSMKTVILASRYAVNIYGGTADFGPAEKDRSAMPLISTSSTRRVSRAEAERIFAEKLSETVRKLEDLGKRVILVDPIPEVGYNVPRVLARNLLTGNAAQDFTRPYSYYAQRQRFIIKEIRSLADQYHLAVIRPQDKLCDAQRCLTEVAGKPLYFDDDHLSVFGSNYIAPIFSQVLKERDMPEKTVDMRPGRADVPPIAGP